MRWWLKSLAVGAAVGLVVGLIVGGTLGRVFMRILFLAEEDTLGLRTAMDAVIGEFTRTGTTTIYAFGAIAGVPLGLAYTAGRALLPSGTRVRTIIFTSGTTAFMLGQIVRGNREDFAILPVTLSLLLIVGSVALTAAPVPLLIERFAPDRKRSPGRISHSVVLLGMGGFAVYGLTGIGFAYAT